MQHRNYIPYSESTGPQRPLDRLDDRAEPGIEQIAGHVSVVLDRDRMGEAVARVEVLRNAYPENFLWLPLSVRRSVITYCRATRSYI